MIKKVRIGLSSLLIVSGIWIASAAGREAVTATPLQNPGRFRVGAICSDGWTSSATGSGACSHHGGVSCWRYSDGTCTMP